MKRVKIVITEEEKQISSIRRAINAAKIMGSKRSQTLIREPGKRNQFSIWAIYPARCTEIVYYCVGSREDVERHWEELIDRTSSEYPNENIVVHNIYVKWGKHFSVRLLETAAKRSEIVALYKNLNEQFPLMPCEDLRRFKPERLDVQDFY
jgi:hypothetical protein